MEENDTKTLGRVSKETTPKVEVPNGIDGK